MKMMFVQWNLDYVDFTTDGKRILEMINFVCLKCLEWSLWKLFAFGDEQGSESLKKNSLKLKGNALITLRKISSKMRRSILTPSNPSRKVTQSLHIDFHTTLLRKFQLKMLVHYENYVRISFFIKKNFNVNIDNNIKKFIFIVMIVVVPKNRRIFIVHL